MKRGKIKRKYFFLFFAARVITVNVTEEETDTKKYKMEMSHLPNTSQKTTNIALVSKNQLVNLPVELLSSIKL